MVTTRVGSVADISVLGRLWTVAALGRRAEAGLPTEGEEADAENQVRRRLADERNFAVLAEDGGEVVAMTLVLQALDLDSAGREPLSGLAHVSMVAVAPGRWGQGLGAVVLAEAQREAGVRGFRAAQLYTHETNRRAQRLYERLGWVASGRTRADGHGEVIRHYAREL